MSLIMGREFGSRLSSAERVTAKKSRILLIPDVQCERDGSLSLVVLPKKKSCQLKHRIIAVLAMASRCLQRSLRVSRTVLSPRVITRPLHVSHSLRQEQREEKPTNNGRTTHFGFETISESEKEARGTLNFSIRGR